MASFVIICYNHTPCSSDSACLHIPSTPLCPAFKLKLIWLPVALGTRLNDLLDLLNALFAQVLYRITSNSFSQSLIKNVRMIYFKVIDRLSRWALWPSRILIVPVIQMQHTKLPPIITYVLLKKHSISRRPLAMTVVKCVGIHCFTYLYERSVTTTKRSSTLKQCTRIQLTTDIASGLREI